MASYTYRLSKDRRTTRIHRDTNIHRRYDPSQRSDWILWGPKNVLFLTLCSECQQSLLNQDKVVKISILLQLYLLEKYNIYSNKYNIIRT